ncbi:MC family mitochondrial carrier protein [Tothia fuscella]|uniref:Mitochondrial glycine transporter n=1 Tax=Tothia fuscella TaxID=1048955 RepID=A0A9P4NHQ5_9PEZI|nr:MC family mitochondrial carrier protein [Tothia fuscella]
MSNGLFTPGTKKKTNKSSFHFLAGLTSGTFTAILLQPADLLKTRIQQASKTANPHPLLSTLRAITSSPRPIAQLWRGTVPSALRTGAGSALYFGGLNALRMRVGKIEGGSKTRREGSEPANGKGIGRTANLLTGAVARASAGFAMMPITVIKVRFESSMYAYRSVWSAGKDILRSEGLKGFFAGFGATAVRDAPYAGLYVLFYEEGKRLLHTLTPTQVYNTDKPAVGINFLSGILAAATATAITNPFDAIKTRLQLMPQRYGNMLQAGRMMVQQEGVRCLFDGLALRMGRKAVSSALAWTVYEELIRRAEIRWLAEEMAV